MRWETLMRWLTRRTSPNSFGEYREFVEHRLDATRRMRPVCERLAPHVQALPPQELADRLRRAMTREPS